MTESTYSVIETENIIPVTYGCASHCLNNLKKNITTDFIMANVAKIQKYFRNYDTPRSLLKEYADWLNHKFQVKQGETYK